MCTECDSGRQDGTAVGLYGIPKAVTVQEDAGFPTSPRRKLYIPRAFAETPEVRPLQSCHFQVRVLVDSPLLSGKGANILMPASGTG